MTLGARLAILPQPAARSSLATTPLTRVPSGSFLLFSRTHALSSKRMTRPSGLVISFLVRTMTACRTSPRRTFCVFAWPGVLETGRAFCTTTTISSPEKDNSKSSRERVSSQFVKGWNYSVVETTYQLDLDLGLSCFAVHSRILQSARRSCR